MTTVLTHDVLEPNESPTSYEVGLWQEKITWKIINNVYDIHLGTSQFETDTNPDVKRKVTWTQGNDNYALKWYQPNTHPIHVGAISKPEFGIVVNGVETLNIESKNWHVNYKPLSLYQVDKQIISRYRYVNAPVNVLIISELRLEESDAEKILNLFEEWSVKVILTHRQATSDTDIDSYGIIRSELEPVLLDLIDPK
jgi:hypothetical protein